jgi:hypothetical protein
MEIDFFQNGYPPRIRLIAGSVFDTEKYGLEAIVIFVPGGLTSFRLRAKKFVGQFDEPIEHKKGISLYQNNTYPNLYPNLKSVLIQTNEKHIIYRSERVYGIVSHVFETMTTLGIKRFGMNGIRIDEHRPEAILLYYVRLWLKQNEHDFEEISFIDLRNGFMKNCL